MYVILTTVQIKPGKIDQVRDMFVDIYNELVDGQEHWKSTVFSADRVENMIMVLNFWTDIEAHWNFRNSDKYQAAMEECSQFFSGPVKIHVNEVLFEM